MSGTSTDDAGRLPENGGGERQHARVTGMITRLIQSVPGAMEDDGSRRRER
jgi:hypothetical protein